MKTLGRALVAVWLMMLGASAQAQEVRVTNLRSGEKLRYPVALISGQVALPDGTPLTLRNDSSDKPNNHFVTSVLGGRFKALMELVPGDNELSFGGAAGEQPFRLRYEPMTNPQLVRIIYVVDSGGETRYPTQFENDPQNFRAKLQTAARLIQTFTAETMNESGWGRKTFRLEEDERGEVVVHVVRTPREAAYYQGIPNGEIGGVMRGIINPQFPTGQARNLVINNTAGYDPVGRRMLGHCAESAAGTGVFSALNIFAWPSNLQEVQRAFSNQTPTDQSLVADDSNGRNRLWAVAATTVGVTLHELGHAFNIPHSDDNLGIMSRGHDYFNRNFTLIEPPHARRNAFFPFPDDQRSRFESGNASRLALHSFFQPDPLPKSGLPAPSIDLDYATADIEVRAPAGLRALSIEREGRLRDTIALRDEAPQTRVFSRAELQKLAKATDFALVAIDSEGRGAFMGAAQLADQRPFLRSWHLSPLIAWRDTKDFPRVTAAQLRELTEQTAARPARMSFSSLFDIGAHLRGSGDTKNKVAYAYRSIESDADRRVLLLTGSDDALRVWVNGQLVTEKGVFREAKVDEDQTPITLKKGRNAVLIEVVNVDGGWGFYCRMVDASNSFLYVATDGSLSRLDAFWDAQRFARSWQLAEKTAPWPSLSAATDREPARAAQLEAELAPLQSQTSHSPFIDLRAHYHGREPVEARVTHARTIIRSDRERQVTLLTGSDDTIRVWVNGEIKLERLSGRAGNPDDDHTPIALRAGENQIIVEVATGNGGWGFYLRFDENGAPLWIREDGTLSPTRE